MGGELANSSIILCGLNGFVDACNNEIQDDMVLSKERNKYFVEVNTIKGFEFLRSMSIDKKINEDHIFPKCYEAVLDM